MATITRHLYRHRQTEDGNPKAYVLLHLAEAIGLTVRRYEWRGKLDGFNAENAAGNELSVIWHEGSYSGQSLYGHTVETWTRTHPNPLGWMPTGQVAAVIKRLAGYDPRTISTWPYGPHVGEDIPF